MDLLNSEPVVSLSGDEFLPIEGKTFIQQVQEFFAAQGGKANSPFGTVLLDKKGIKNDIGHGIGRLKAVSFAAVKDVLEKGVVINPMGQYHTNNKKNPTGMIAAPITIGGEKYVCVVEVIANRQVTRLYVHEVTLTKNLQGGVADSNAVPGDTNLVTQPQGEIAKVLRNYVNTKNNDENNSKTENRHMNKKLVKLTESDLKQIVKESVNNILSEAYGTMQSRTKDIIDTINDNDKTKYEGGSSAANIGAAINKFKKDIVIARNNLRYNGYVDSERNMRSWTRNVYNDGLYDDFNNKYNPSGYDTQKYLDAIDKCITRATKIADKMKDALIMNQGGIPNKAIHKDNEYGGGYGYGDSEQYDYSGLPGWGG